MTPPTVNVEPAAVIVVFELRLTEPVPKFKFEEPEKVMLPPQD